MNQMTGFIPKNLKIESWQCLEPYFTSLKTESLTHVEQLEKFIHKFSDVLSVYAEQFYRSYIEMTRFTNDEQRKQSYENFATNIDPEFKKAEEKIYRKILNSPFQAELNSQQYNILLKKLKNKIRLYRDENMPLKTELELLSSQYRQITGNLTVNIDDKDLTLQQAAVYLKHNDRTKRQEAWQKIQDIRLETKPKLDDLFNRMLKLRHQVALNADFENFRDYSHLAKERFDYTPNACFEFHESVKKHALPLFKKIMLRHQERVNLTGENYRPWDTEAISNNEQQLIPFQTTKELLEKTKTIFEKLDPEFKTNLEKMAKANLFDLDSRIGKAPGGYNCHLEITGMPFIFMNAANVHRDVITLMHEGGHAMHNFLTQNLALIFQRDFSHEIAETASMSMELMTADFWNEFYNSKQHKQARIEHLEGIVSRLPWIALVDKFQHWIYTNPEHTTKERDDFFVKLMQEFGTGLINWNGLEKELANQWQKQLHIFEYPFYYIEYGIAQIGALQVYQNFKKDPKDALESYKNGLKLGGTRPLPELWQAMNIDFDFSANKISDLMKFIEQELDGLYE